MLGQLILTKQIGLPHTSCRPIGWFTAGLVQCEVRMERGVFAGVAGEDHEFAGINGPLVSRRVPVAEGASIEVDGHVFCLAGSEAHLLKTLQFTLRTLDRRGRIGDVELGDLRSGHASSIGYIEAD